MKRKRDLFLGFAVLLIAAIFTLAGCDNSTNGGGNEGDPNKVATPTATPKPGAVNSGTTVTLASSTSGAAIHYTTNNSAPTSSSTLYSSPIPITSATTIKAIAVKAGMTDSDVLTAAYTITGGGGGGGGGGGDPAVDCAADEVWINNASDESSVVFKSGNFYYVDKSNGVWSVSMYGYTYSNGTISGMALPLSYSVSNGTLTIKMSGTTMGTYTKQSGQTVDLTTP